MQNQIKLGIVVQLGFGIIFFLMLVIGIVSKLSRDRLTEATALVTKTYQIEGKLKELEKLLVDGETGQRGFIYTGQEKFLQPYNQAKTRLAAKLTELRKEISNPEQLKRMDRLEELSQQKMDELADTIALKRSSKEQELRKLVLSEKGKKIMDQIRKQVTEMIQLEDKLLAERQKTAAQAENLAHNVSIGGTFTAILFGGCILIFIARKIVLPINQVANTIAASCSQIAATIEEQERMASQQAAAVNQTTTTMDELGASSQRSAEQAEGAASAAGQILTLANGRRDNYSAVIEENSLKQKVVAISQQIHRLSEQTQQIGRISNLVSELANQTNMLALNAAVEAVRAGEHGKGFAVVASEIRKLADQSKQSAERINTILVDIQTATSSTVKVTEEGKSTLEKIVGAIDEVAVSSQQISLNAKQQAIAIQQVVEAMNNLNLAASQAASDIGQTKITMQNLNEAAINLKSVV